MVWGIQLALFCRLMKEWACRVSEGINSCEAEGTPPGESPMLPVIMLPDTTPLYVGQHTAGIHDS